MGPRRKRSRLKLSLRGARAAVLSPHLDDAVFSLGAGIACAARHGSPVRVVTVFSGDPTTDAPASEWDRLPGWTTEREAVLARRREDVEAMRIVGAEARWLPFADETYGRPRDPDAIHGRIDEATRGYDVVFVPGAPLSHNDHRYLTDLVLRRGLSGRRLVLYAEQPYRYWLRDERPDPRIPPKVKALLPTAPTWTTLEADPLDFARKWAATRAYRSQLALLGLHRRRGLRLARVVADRLPRGERVMPVTHA